MKLVPWKSVSGWRCVRCGKCCSELDVPVSDEEENRLKKYGNVFRRGKIGVYIKKVNGRCVFLRNNQCAIYDERPKACRRYPFYFRKKGDENALFIFKGKRFYVYVDADCKGLGMEGDVEEEIKRILDDN